MVDLWQRYRRSCYNEWQVNEINKFYQQCNMLKLLAPPYIRRRDFPHTYQIQGKHCKSHERRLMVEQGGSSSSKRRSFRRSQGITALDFDNEGKHLASVTASGCLTIHDFEVLYSLTQKNRINDLEDERNHLLHHTVDCYLDAVRWNPLNQKEVACASEERGEVLLFDLEGSDILSMKFKPASETIMGPFEVDFTSDSRVLASNSAGSVCVWDIRSGKQASKLQSTNPTGDALYGMAIAADKQTVVAGGSLGKLYAWDIRGGNASLDTIHNRDLRKIVGNSSEKVIQPFSVVENLNLTGPGLYPNIDNCVNSLNFNPVRPSHVAYNLSCDWVGIYDVRIDSITHKFKQNQESCGYRRKCSWLPLGSICLVGSEIERVQGVRFLDFHPNQRSLIYSENFVRDERTKFLPVEKFVNSCAAHPIYDAVVSGTEENSLLVLSQPRESFLPEDPYP